MLKRHISSQSGSCTLIVINRLVINYLVHSCELDIL